MTRRRRPSRGPARGRSPTTRSLFLNIGTTTEAVARELLNHRNLTVVTNNMNVANILVANESCEIMVAGGVLRRSDGGLVGDLTAQFIEQFKVDFAIIGASALDADGDLLDFDLQEVRVSKALIRRARRTFLVADASKFAALRPGQDRLAARDRRLLHRPAAVAPAGRSVPRVGDRGQPRGLIPSSFSVHKYPTGGPGGVKPPRARRGARRRRAQPSTIWR